MLYLSIYYDTGKFVNFFSRFRCSILDSGEYTCTATNTQGAIFCSFNIHVEGRPIYHFFTPKVQTLSLSWKFDCSYVDWSPIFQAREFQVRLCCSEQPICTLLLNFAIAVLCTFSLSHLYRYLCELLSNSPAFINTTFHAHTYMTSRKFVSPKPAQ